MAREPIDMIEDIERQDGTDYGDGPELEEDDVEEGDEGDEGEEAGGDSVDEGGEPEPRPKRAKKEITETKDGRKIKKTHDPHKERGEIRRLSTGQHIDSKGNIVDPRDGTIIARAGSERRMYENNMRTNIQLEEARRENQTLKEQVVQKQYLDSVPQRFNLQPDDVQHALALAAVYKQNPVEAARNLVEMVLAQGHNVSEILGNDAGNAIEMGGVRAMIAEQLAPLTQQNEQKRKQAEAQQAAQAGLRQFFNEHEHSETHAIVLDRLMGTNPDLTPERAYYELKTFCAKHGLDFTQELQPQLAQIARGEQQQQLQHTQPARQRRASLPNGRSGGSAHRSVNDTELADHSATWGDIIRSSM